MSERPDPLAEPEGYGSRLGRIAHLANPASSDGREPVIQADLDEDGQAIDDICDYRPAKGIRCRQQRTWHWDAGDINEHIAPMDICAAHEGTVRRQIQSGIRFSCTVCQKPMTVEHRYPVDADGSLGTDEGRIVLSSPPPGVLEGVFGWYDR